MRLMFVTAELAPLVKVGGLGDAVSGLVKALRTLGVSVDVLVPDYEGLSGDDPRSQSLSMPSWIEEASSLEIEVGGFGPVTLVSTPGMARPHPYDDSSGHGWGDNDRRFFSFAAAAAQLVSERQPDLVHIHDWHTGPTLGFLEHPPASVLTIHNPAYQGTTSLDWLSIIPRRPEAYEWYGGTNPLTGAIALADAVATVSPTFAEELTREDKSFGLAGPLLARGDRFVGIANGIDTEVWDPATDTHLPRNYDGTSVSRKRELGRELAIEMGLRADSGPIVGMVTRLTEQKGVDLALAAAPMLAEEGARLVLLGSGDRDLADYAGSVAADLGDSFVFHNGYDEGLSHRIFGGSDLILVPSRFEPCGLTQMQAMRYGAIPVVTDVGGLHDTVIDADRDLSGGTGFVAAEPTADAFADAARRAVRAWRSTRRRGRIRARGMSEDWSWEKPARAYLDLYRQVIAARR